MKAKALIFGAGQIFFHGKDTISAIYDIVGVIDNSTEKQGEDVRGFIVREFCEIFSFEFDVVIVTPQNNNAMIDQLIRNGIALSKIIKMQDMYYRTFEGTKLHIALIFHGGLGDFLIGKNWLYHLALKYDLKDSVIDVFFEDKAFEDGKSVFGDCQFIQRIHSLNLGYQSLYDKNSYDLVIRFCIVPYVQYYNGEKIAYLNRRFLGYVLELQKYGLYHYNPGFCSSPSYFKTVRNIFEQFPNKNYFSFCDLFNELDITETFIIPFSVQIDEEQYLRELGLSGRQFITLDTGLNQNYLGKTNTRSWSHENWEKLARLLRSNYQELPIVQIGAKMTENDNIEADLNLNGKTDIEQVKVLMKNALLHIDYEGGLVHVRHILGGGTSIVLFGSTGIPWHGYSENINIRTNECPCGCEWTTENWLCECPRGVEPPICMESITPEMVYEEAVKYLAAR